MLGNRVHHRRVPLKTAKNQKNEYGYGSLLSQRENFKATRAVRHDMEEDTSRRLVDMNDVLPLTSERHDNDASRRHRHVHIHRVAANPNIANSDARQKVQKIRERMLKVRSGDLMSSTDTVSAAHPLPEHVEIPSEDVVEKKKAYMMKMRKDRQRTNELALRVVGRLTMQSVCLIRSFLTSFMCRF